MILRLYNGAEYEIDKRSVTNCFVVITDSAPTAFPLLTALTDMNLTEYSLVEDTKTTTCKHGHLSSTRTYLQPDGKWRTDYYIKIVADSTDYKAMADKLSTDLASSQAALAERDRALAILFGEEE